MVQGRDVLCGLLHLLFQRRDGRVYREENGECRATFAGRHAASETNVPPVLLHNSLADPETQPSSDIFLRGKKRFKKLRTDRVRNARPGIENSNENTGNACRPLFSSRNSNPDLAPAFDSVNAIAQDTRGRDH